MLHNKIFHTRCNRFPPHTYIIVRQESRRNAMFRKRRFCKKRSHCGAALIGPLLIAVGIGVFLANIIPSFVLIILFGIALIAVGIWFVCK